MQPYEQPMSWFHHSIKYKKRMFGRYGIDGSDIPLGALWPTKVGQYFVSESQQEYSSRVSFISR
jgi:Growth arrest and DNA-damage-inducible proteins-interacting protein 1